MPLKVKGRESLATSVGDLLGRSAVRTFRLSDVKSDCLAKLRGQIPGRGMRVVSAVRGENSFIVDVQIDGVPNLWRCYHDGTRCTGTEYQGEG